jgi:diguanylate cyclase (GGDEF)-like protein
MEKDQTAEGALSATQGGSDRPPSSKPPVASLDQPAIPVAELRAQRRQTLRFAAAVDRISTGEPVDAELIASMRNQLAELAATNKRLEEELRSRDRRLLALTAAIRSTSDGIIACDMSGAITLFNPGAEKIFQLEMHATASETETSSAIGLNFFDFCEEHLYRGETGSAPDAGLLDRLKANGTVQNLRVVFRGDGGKVTHTLITVDYSRDPETGRAIGYIATIKDNSEVEALAQVDALTGLVNRRVLELKVRETYGLLKRGHFERDCVSAIFLDVDHFGDFNKKYGHDVGDAVLRAVAETLRHCGRDIDTVARYGGEEFVILLPSVDETDARHVAERIRKSIEETKVQLSGRSSLSVTASIGVTTHRKGSGTMKAVLSDRDKDQLVEDFLKKANQAMLEAKRSGRNRVRAA